MNRIATVLLAIATIAVLTSPASAQYMYLDSNGNGVHDSGDQLAPNGTATTVDLWINTNHNRDGSVADCDVEPGSPLGINSYVVNLLAANGLVSYGAFTNLSPGTVNFGELNPGDGLRYKNGYGSPNTQPPGLYRLATITITGLSGTPRVDIVDLVSGSNDFTSFGTGAGGCFGRDFDNTYKLAGPSGGTDWHDADGVARNTPIDTPPVVNNPGNKTVNEGNCLNFTVTGSAPNGHAMSFFLILNPPSGASITTGGQFSWCPTEAQGPGDYSITVSGMDNVTSLTSSATFQIHVNEVNQAPVLSPISDKTVNFGHILSFAVTTTDPDLPVNGLTYSTDPGTPSGVQVSGNFFQWNPLGNVPQAGVYPFTLRVTDNGVPPLSDAKTFNVTVQPAGTGAPVINNPGNLTAQAGTTVDVPVTGSDPNNLPLHFLKGAGSPAFMSVTTVNATTGNIHISTSLSMVGTYPASVIADNGIETSQTSFTIMITPGDNPPVLQAPANMTVAEGDVADQTLTATDPDNTPITFTKATGPLFMTVTTTTATTGNIHLEPGFADAGSYPASIQASDGQLSDFKPLQITVLNVCQAPIANAGGPYSAFVGAPVMFNGSGSSDPDGGALSYAWNFGDGTTGTGPTPSHAYAAAGSYGVTLRVTTSCGRFADATSTASITGTCLSALAFTEGGNNKTSLGAGKPQTCFLIQPVNGSFSIDNVDLSTVVMISEGTGAVSQIHAVANKTAVGGDKNNDGIDEISACFTKADLQQIFSNIQGTQVVTINLQGNLFTGGSFCTTLNHTVKSGGGGNHVASIYPNPLNPSAVLTFSTTKAGAAKVQLFDMHGRLIKTLLDDATTTAGDHDVRIDGRDAMGNKLASGVYYVKIQSVEGTEAKAITILK